MPAKTRLLCNGRPQSTIASLTWSYIRYYPSCCLPQRINQDCGVCVFGLALCSNCKKCGTSLSCLILPSYCWRKTKSPLSAALDVRWHASSTTNVVGRCRRSRSTALHCIRLSAWLARVLMTKYRSGDSVLGDTSPFNLGELAIEMGDHTFRLRKRIPRKSFGAPPPWEDGRIVAKQLCGRIETYCTTVAVVAMCHSLLSSSFAYLSIIESTWKAEWLPILQRKTYQSWLVLL